MKKLILLVIGLTLLLNYSYSQEAGRTILGGSFNFSTDFDGQEQILIAPVIGGMVSDKVAIGLMGSYSKSINFDSYMGSYVSKDLTLDLFVRTHKNITENFKFYTNFYAGKIIDVSKSTNKVKNFHAGVNFGVLYFMSQKLSLELNIADIQYQHFKTSFSNYDYLNLGFDLLTPTVGLKFYL